jgi:hypothetical protein
MECRQRGDRSPTDLNKDSFYRNRDHQRQQLSDSIRPSDFHDLQMAIRNVVPI